MNTEAIGATASPTWMDRIATLTLIIAGAALVSVAGVEGWQVFARYVLNNSPSWTEPVALLAMSTAMMCGAALGVRGGRHFGFFMLVEHARPSVQRALRVIALLISIFVGGMFFIAGSRLVRESWDYPMAGAPLPQGVVYMPICMGGALIVLFALEKLLSMRAAGSDLQPSVLSPPP